jgi:prolyl oligopeptidase
MKKILIFLLFFSLILKFNNAQILQSSKIWNYPFIAPDTAIDDYFGRKVIDPYRNLENMENEYIKTWMKNQNIFYDSIIQNITFRDSIKKELKTLSKMGKKWTGYSRIAGNRIFYTIGNLSDYNIKLVYIDSLNAEPIELFNTREFNKKDSC